MANVLQDNENINTSPNVLQTGQSELVDFGNALQENTPQGTAGDPPADGGVQIVPTPDIPRIQVPDIQVPGYTVTPAPDDVPDNVLRHQALDIPPEDFVDPNAPQIVPGDTTAFWDYVNNNLGAFIDPAAFQGMSQASIDVVNGMLTGSTPATRALQAKEASAMAGSIRNLMNHIGNTAASAGITGGELRRLQTSAVGKIGDMMGNFAMDNIIRMGETQEAGLQGFMDMLKLNSEEQRAWLKVATDYEDMTLTHNEIDREFGWDADLIIIDAMKDNPELMLLYNKARDGGIGTLTPDERATLQAAYYDGWTTDEGINQQDFNTKLGYKSVWDPLMNDDGSPVLNSAGEQVYEVKKDSTMSLDANGNMIVTITPIDDITDTGLGADDNGSVTFDGEMLTHNGYAIVKDETSNTGYRDGNGDEVVVTLAGSVKEPGVGTGETVNIAEFGDNLNVLHTWGTWTVADNPSGEIGETTLFYDSGSGETMTLQEMVDAAAKPGGKFNQEPHFTNVHNMLLAAGKGNMLNPTMANAPVPEPEKDLGILTTDTGEQFDIVAKPMDNWDVVIDPNASTSAPFLYISNDGAGNYNVFTESQMRENVSPGGIWNKSQDFWNVKHIMGDEWDTALESGVDFDVPGHLKIDPPPHDPLLIAAQKNFDSLAAGETQFFDDPNVQALLKNLPVENPTFNWAPSLDAAKAVMARYPIGTILNSNSNDPSIVTSIGHTYHDPWGPGKYRTYTMSTRNLRTGKITERTFNANY